MRRLFAMPYKQPRSVQVVVFSESEGKRLYLLLRRVQSHGRFWQSVTGSLEDEETHLQAAVREVREETGCNVREDQLIDLGVTNVFEIAPQWRSRYAPGVMINEEVCFALPVEHLRVEIDHQEHDQYVWVDYAAALGMLYWESNRRTLEVVNRLRNE